MIDVKVVYALLTVSKEEKAHIPCQKLNCVLEG